MKKNAIKTSISICLLVGLGSILTAQENTISPAFKESTINELSSRMNDFYVTPDIAEKTNEHLSNQLEAGHFDSFTTLEAFAEALSKEAQSFSNDKHLLVRPTRPMQAEENSIERVFERHMYRLAYARDNAGGFQEAKKLEGNVGYLEIRSFAELSIGADYADSSMQLLSTSDAIIIDLRENGGGNPEMVQYLCSYFFDEKVHLNSLYWREGDRTVEFWSLDTVNGQKLPDVPLFVLTSGQTFSAAEEFSYNMQTQKRATLVGESTKGGANPGRLLQLNDELEAFIPIGKAVNPITKTNWEGVGVIPDVETSAEEALTKAHELATAAGIEYRARVKQKQMDLSTELIGILESFDAKSDEAVYEKLKECEQAGLLEKEMINGIGYEYLMNFEKPKVAEAIFKANTRLFPDDANGFDSFAEALATNGKLKESAANYQKAIEIAKATDSPELKQYEENLAKIEARIADETTDEKLPPTPEPVSDFVRRIFQDKSGNLWLGTNGDGVIRYDGNALETFSIGEGFGGVAVRGIVEDNEGNVWFGTEQGITRYDGNSFTNYTETDGLINNDVWSIAIDSQGIIWIGTFQGVSRFDGKTFTPFVLPEVQPDNTRGFPSGKMVNCIMEDSKGMMWFGTSGGAFVFDGKSLTNISEKDGLCNNSVNCILEDKEGKIWFATHHQGVCRWDGTSFTHFTPEDGVHGTEAWNLYEDRSGNIWFPIENSGVYRYDGKSFTNFQQEQGLVSNAIQCTFEDNEGRLWLGGWMGLFRYDGNSIFSVTKDGPWK